MFTFIWRMPKSRGVNKTAAAGRLLAPVLAVCLFCCVPAVSGVGEAAGETAGTVTEEAAQETAEETAEETDEVTVAKVTTPQGPLNMRAKAEKNSTVVGLIPNGTCLLVLKEGERWCLCSWEDTEGYCSTEFLTFLRDADPALTGYRVLRRGMRGEDVLKMKERLRELGYFREGSSLTDVYNDTAAERVRMFQRQIGADEDGVASQELQFYLFSDRAPKCDQALPSLRSPVLTEDNGLRKEICGCCMGEGCECCDFRGWIWY